MTISGTEAKSEMGIEDFASELSTLKDEYDAVLGGGRQGDGPSRHGVSSDAWGQNLAGVLQIPVAVKAVLGSTTVPISTLMKLRRGTVLALDRKVGEPIEVTVNGRVVARGEVVVLEDGTPRLGISLTEVVGRYGSQNDEAQHEKHPGQLR